MENSVYDNAVFFTFLLISLIILIAMFIRYYKLFKEHDGEIMDAAADELRRDAERPVKKDIPDRPNPNIRATRVFSIVFAVSLVLLLLDRAGLFPSMHDSGLYKLLIIILFFILISSGVGTIQSYIDMRNYDKFHKLYPDLVFDNRSYGAFCEKYKKYVNMDWYKNRKK